ncbi:MAG: hypothetical protein WA110_06420 [Anaerolineaceae bacterium]
MTKTKFIHLGLVRNVQAAALAAACITLLMMIAILQQINSANLDLNKSLTGLPRQTYDILVRSPQAIDPIEVKYDLIEPNHLNGINGGISFAQFEQIKTIADVEVAAPVAMLGYYPQNLNMIKLLDPLPWGLYKIELSNRVSNGINAYEVKYKNPVYGFYTDARSFSLGVDFERETAIIKEKGYFRVSNLDDTSDFGFWMSNGIKEILVAAIDPEEEAKLLGLDQLIIKGTYLSSDNSSLPSDYGLKFIQVPALLNNKNYLDQTYLVKLTRLEVPYANKGDALDQMESLPAIAELNNYPESNIYQFEIPMSGFNTSMDSLLTVKDNQVISQRNAVLAIDGKQSSPSKVSYEVYNGKVEGWQGFEPIFEAVPQALIGGEDDDMDTFFCDSSAQTCLNNRIWEIPAEISYRPQSLSSNQMSIYFYGVGQYDVEQIIKAHANELNEVPLETYNPPEATLKYSDDGKELPQPIPIHPTLNSYGYLTTPPDALISLASLQELILNSCTVYPENSSNGLEQIECPQKDNFISAIRVRVGGITTMDESAEEKVIAVAKEITELTGLKADVMVGASLQPVLVHIPGMDGIPAVGFVEENWIKKGVTTSYSKGFTLITALAALAMVSAGSLLILLMNYQALLSYQDEFLLLHTLGWKKSTIFSQRLLPTMLMQLVVFVALLAIVFTVPGVKELVPSMQSAIILLFVVVVYSFIIFYVPYRLIFYKKKDLVDSAETNDSSE